MRRAWLPLLLALAGCDEEAETSCGECGPCTGTVERIIDGDTIELASGDKIRYLGVDTPETTSGKNECYGAEAVRYNRDRVLDREVRLEYDAACTDRYGRLLAYVYVGDEMINRALLSRGYGDVLIIAPNGRYEAEMNDDVRRARAAKRGLWGACEE